MTSLGGWPSTTQATYRGTRQPGCLSSGCGRRSLPTVSRRWSRRPRSRNGVVRRNVRWLRATTLGCEHWQRMWTGEAIESGPRRGRTLAEIRARPSIRAAEASALLGANGLSRRSGPGDEVHSRRACRTTTVMDSRLRGNDEGLDVAGVGSRLTDGEVRVWPEGREYRATGYAPLKHRSLLEPRTDCAGDGCQFALECPAAFRGKVSKGPGRRRSSSSRLTGGEVGLAGGPRAPLDTRR